MAKKKKKIRGLCLVLSFVLSIGFCLAGVPGKKILAEGFEKDRSFLMIGDTILVKDGEWTDAAKANLQDGIYNGGDFIVKECDRGARIFFTKEGGTCGGILVDRLRLEFGGVTFDVLDKYADDDDHTHTFIANIGSITESQATAATAAFAGEDYHPDFSDAVGYSVYCRDMGFSFNYFGESFNIGRASFEYNLSGGIRHGGVDGFKISGETTVNVGKDGTPAEIGIANIDCNGMTEFDSGSLQQHFVLNGNLNIYAKVPFLNVDFVYVEGGTLYAESEGGDGAIIVANPDPQDNPTNIVNISDGKTDFEVAYGGSIQIESAHGVGDIGRSGCKYLKDKTDIQKDEADNSVFVNIETDSADEKHYSIDNSSNSSYKLESKDPKMSTFGWGAGSEEYGTVKIVDGKGFHWGMPDETSWLLAQGTDVTIEVMPKYGYQYRTEGFVDKSGKALVSTPQKEVATYTFEVQQYAVALNGPDCFKKVEDKVEDKSNNVENAEFAIGDKDKDNINGNLVLTVGDSDASADAFIAAAGGENIESVGVIELTIDQKINKGDSKTESWDDNKSEFSDNVNVKLGLSKAVLDQINDGDEVIVYRDHDGKKEEVDATIDLGRGELGVDSNKFSTFAILVKSADDNNTPTQENKQDDDENPPQPPRGDVQDDDNPPPPPPGEEGGPDDHDEADEERITVTDDATGVAVELTAWEGVEHFKADVQNLKDDIAGASADEIAAVKTLFEVPEGYEFLLGYEIFVQSNVDDPNEYNDVFGRDPIITIPVGDLADIYDLKLIYYVNDEWETFVKYPEFTIKDGKLIVGDVETDGQFFVIGKALAKAADVEEPAETETKKPASDGSPKTGDSSDPALMFMLLIASAGMIIMLRKSKNRE